MPEQLRTYEDQNYDPSVEPESSRIWLNLITDAEKKFKDYQDQSDKIDKIYANLSRQSRRKDREFALFWSTIQVILPSIYARTPVPVIVPKFNDNKQELNVASEFLERATVTAFDKAHIHDVMLLVRDDLAITGRGTAWVRYDTKKDERICFDFLDRKDFLHDPARNWSEVKWVARRAWMNFDEMEERFQPTSGDKYKDAAFEVQSRLFPKSAVDPRQQAAVWEIWHKGENRVVWVAEGVDVVLDSGEPHLDLECFWPCPKPAYTTVERRSLVPVPDALYYDDQLEEINSLTARIHALADAVQVKGFYPQGGDVGDAVDAAIGMNDPRKVMIPVKNWAAFGQGGDPIVWLPIDMIATTIAGLIEMRRQIIDDVYQVVGMPDIMRGATEAEETAKAQQIKRESGAVRVREKVNELARFARDLAAISAEIMAEEFEQKTLEDMAQMDLPTKKDIEKDIAGIEKAAKTAFESLEKKIKDQIEEARAQGPEAVQQMQAQAEQQLQAGQQEIIQQFNPRLAELRNMVSIDAVMDLLRDQRLRPFMLDIETDSTVFQDEQMEKQQRGEWMQAFSNSLAALQPLLASGKSGAKAAGEIIKFSLAPYRVGRQLDGVIDEFVENAPQELAAQEGDGEGEELAAANMKLAEAELAKAQAQGQKVQADAALKSQELEQRANEWQTKAQQDQQRFQLEMEKSRGTVEETLARIEKIYAEIQKMGVESQVSIVKAQDDTRKTDIDEFRAASDAQSKQVDQQRAAVNDERSASMSERQQEFNERQAETQGD